MGIWESVDRDTPVRFCTQRNGSGETIHLYVGDRLEVDSCCLEVAIPEWIDPVEVTLARLCRTCAETLIGWIDEAQGKGR